MKTINVIGMSVAAAGLLMTGCGSGSGSSSSSSTISSGDAVIKSLKEPMDMTDQNVTNVLNFLKSQFSQFGGMGPKVAALKANFKAVPDANFAVASSEPQPCEISGTVTYTENYTDTANGFTDDWSTVWDNCVETVAWPSSIDGIELNIRTSNGTRSSTYSYSDDGNRTIDHFSGADNYTQVYENNETQTVSRTSTRQMSVEGRFEWNDTYGSMMLWQDGMSMNVDVNSSGDTILGSKTVAENFIIEEYGRSDGSEGFMSADGGISYYWQGIAEDAVYFDNFKYEWTRMNQEKTVLINGTAGSLCLGGSVSLQTTTAIKENQVDYFDDSNNTGSNVLPYAGDISLTGADSVTATVGFDTNDTNHTSATVTIGEGEPSTYTSWSDMTSGSTCGINIFIN